MGYSAPQQEDGDLSSCELFVRQHYPASCSVVGWWMWDTEPPSSHDQILRLGGSHNSDTHLLGRGQPVVLVLSEGGAVKCFKCCREEEGSQVQLLEVELGRRDVGMMMDTLLVTLRLRAAAELTLPADGGGKGGMSQ